MKKEDIYFVVYIPDLRRCWVFDFFYHQLDDTERLWETIPLSDIVEVNDGWIPPTAPDDCRSYTMTHKTCCFWTSYKRVRGRN